MLKNLKFRLNLQLFADEGGNGGGVSITVSSGSNTSSGDSTGAQSVNSVPTTGTNPMNVRGANQPLRGPERTFTQSQVNDLVRDRISRVYGRYGVKNGDELTSMINRARSYDVMKERFDKLTADNQGLNEKLAFISNNVNPDRYDDVRAFFKGTDQIFNEGALLEALKTHPEWLSNKSGTNAPQTTIKALGVQTKPQEPIDEKLRASKLFGVDL